MLGDSYNLRFWRVISSELDTVKHMPPPTIREIWTKGSPISIVFSLEEYQWYVADFPSQQVLVVYEFVFPRGGVPGIADKLMFLLTHQDSFWAASAYA